MNVSELYDHIFLDGVESSPVTVAVAKDQYQSLRVSLARLHRNMRDTGLTQESLCARFDAETGHASFWIGQRKMRGALSFTLIEPSNDSEI